MNLMRSQKVRLNLKVIHRFHAQFKNLNAAFFHCLFRRSCFLVLERVTKKVTNTFHFVMNLLSVALFRFSFSLKSHFGLVVQFIEASKMVIKLDKVCFGSMRIVYLYLEETYSFESTC